MSAANAAASLVFTAVTSRSTACCSASSDSPPYSFKLWISKYSSGLSAATRLATSICESKVVLESFASRGAASPLSASAVKNAILRACDSPST